MPTWDEIKAGIFAGESGGDYNALYGYANRPGGAFAGRNVTDMTVDEAIEFTNPGGPYAQHVKGQIGRVATPVGAFQIVGNTLKQAKKWAGLTGNEKMTPETQDRLGKAVLENQGTGAWKGYKGPQTPGTTLTSTPRHVGGAGSGPGYFEEPPAPAETTVVEKEPETIKESIQQDLAKKEEDSILASLASKAASQREAEAAAYGQFSQIPTGMDVGNPNINFAAAQALMSQLLEKRRSKPPGLSLAGMGGLT